MSIPVVACGAVTAIGVPAVGAHDARMHSPPEWRWSMYPDVFVVTA